MARAGDGSGVARQGADPRRRGEGPRREDARNEVRALREVDVRGAARIEQRLEAASGERVEALALGAVELPERDEAVKAAGGGGGEA